MFQIRRVAPDQGIGYESSALEQIALTDQITYLVPSKEAQTSFLGCSGLLIREARVVLIDSNMGPLETPELLTAVAPDICVISHYHGDHSRYASEAAEFTKAKIYVPAEERRYLVDLHYYVEHCGIENNELAQVWLVWLTEKLKLKPVPSAEPLAAHQIIDAGKSKFEVIPTPGHSPGHQTYWERKQRLLFCTDIGVDTFGPWYGWRDANLEEYISSIAKLIELDARLLVTSHGGIIKHNVKGALQRCLRVMRHREELIARDLDAGLDAAACASKGHIYGDFSRFPDPLDRLYAVWERNMVDQHVRLLQKGGVDSIA